MRMALGTSIVVALAALSTAASDRAGADGASYSYADLRNDWGPSRLGFYEAHLVERSEEGLRFRVSERIAGPSYDEVVVRVPTGASPRQRGKDMRVEIGALAIVAARDGTGVWGRIGLPFGSAPLEHSPLWLGPSAETSKEAEFRRHTIRAWAAIVDNPSNATLERLLVVRERETIVAFALIFGGPRGSVKYTSSFRGLFDWDRLLDRFSAAWKRAYSGSDETVLVNAAPLVTACWESFGARTSDGKNALAAIHAWFALRANSGDVMRASCAKVVRLGYDIDCGDPGVASQELQGIVGAYTSGD